MPGKFLLPELGEGVEQGDIVSIAVSAGDIIEPGQTVLELETDKATVEVPFEEGGEIQEVLVSVGDSVKIGAPLFTYETSSREKDTQNPEAKEKEEAPESNESEDSEKKTEVPASEGEKEETQEKREREEKEKPSGKKEPDVIPAGPAVRRIAREKKIDLTRVKGTGARGRITVEDVEGYSEKSASVAAPGTAPVKLPDFSKFGEVVQEPFSNVRRATAKHLSLSWNTAPHVTQHNLVDVTELESWRKRNAKAVEKKGGKLTVTSIIVKVTAEALRQFPNFNASIDMEQEEVILKKFINIGIAVDTPRGLLVPVLRDVDRKSITEIALEIGEISERARNGKTGLDELAGGCFTVTNLGGIGGHYFTPIINHPEVAILGVSRSRIEPVYRDGEFKPGEIMPLSLSYDHRLIDGADAARFVRWISDALENPFSMLL